MIDAAVDRALERFDDPPGPAVVATSGGVDSTVLARVLVPALRRRGHRPVLAVFDHGWRPFEPELAHVRAIARDLDLDLRVGVGTPDPARVQAVGPEAAAREDRYRWLRSVASGAPIHLGHHRDDQAECTLLFGVAMEARPQDLRRPLLEVPKAAIRALAEQAGWRACEDPTNRDLDRPRNRVRHTVLPRLRAQGSVDALVQRGLAERARRTYVETEALAALPSVRRTARRFHVVLDRPALQRLRPAVARAVLRRCCPTEGRGPSRRALDAALASTHEAGGQRHDLGGGWTAAVAADVVHLCRRAPDTTRQPLTDRVVWPAVGTVSRRPLAGAAPRPSPGPDSEALADQPLWVVPAKTGRRMRPRGLAGTKRVSHLLREAGVPAPRRAGWPLVVDRHDRVLWIPGVRASEHAALPTPGTAATLLLFTDGFARS